MHEQELSQDYIAFALEQIKALQCRVQTLEEEVAQLQEERARLLADALY